MTEAQKTKIKDYRLSGQSFSCIAAALGLSVNTVKSYFRRNRIMSDGVSAENDSQIPVCRNCGAELQLLQKRKPKQFCSDKCRITWWNAHPELLRHKTVTECKCRQCGSKFNSYGKRERKFCSLGCYRKYRSELAGGVNDE